MLRRELLLGSLAAFTAKSASAFSITPQVGGGVGQFDGGISPLSASLVFPGDLASFSGVYGLVPMTMAVYLASFTSPQPCCDYTLYNGSSGSTGTINFVSGRLDTSSIIAANALVSFSGTPNPFIGLWQLRVTKWYDQSGNGNHLLKADVTNTFVLGVRDGVAALYCYPNTFMECLLSGGQRMSTQGGTSVVCCRPFNSIDSGGLSYHAASGDNNGVGLIANALNPTYKTSWGYFNTFLGQTPAGLVASRKVSVSLSQGFASDHGANPVEIGVDKVSTRMPSVTESLFTTAGYSLGVAAGGGGVFAGAIYGAMILPTWSSPADTLKYRNAMNSAFGVKPIDETVNIVMGGFSTLVGAYSSGVPQVQGSITGPYSVAFEQFFADQLNRNVRVSSYAAVLGVDYWGELTARIPGIIANYTAAATRFHYLNLELIPDNSLANFFVSLGAYITAFNSAVAGAGQPAWTIVVGGFTPQQNVTPTYDVLNAALADPTNQALYGFSYNPTVTDTAYNAAVALYGLGNILISSHLTLNGHNLIGTPEGFNFNSFLAP